MSELKQKQIAQMVARELGNFVNPFSFKADEFIKELTCRTHRTLQQKVGELLFRCIKVWANDYRNGVFDGRNEYLCKICTDIDEHMTKENIMGENWYKMPLI